MKFQSTHPVGGATCRTEGAAPQADYFNPRTPWGVRQKTDGAIKKTGISIHAPRGGCDNARLFTSTFTVLFQSTHPVGGATCAGYPKGRQRGFQSTHPVGGATFAIDAKLPVGTFQSTHPVGGATARTLDDDVQALISIHAPRGGCDNARLFTSTFTVLFQSTHPVGGATCAGYPKGRQRGFQSTHPVGGATFAIDAKLPVGTFQSTHPVGGATARTLDDDVQALISIHAPRGGCDNARLFTSTFTVLFQSTHPVGGATMDAAKRLYEQRVISIHAPRGGCDLSKWY